MQSFHNSESPLKVFINNYPDIWDKIKDLWRLYVMLLAAGEISHLLSGEMTNLGRIEITNASVFPFFNVVF